jgi:hypothetical protein
MKILTILNEQNDSNFSDLFKELSEENQVEVVRLSEDQLSYEEVVDKIDQCDKVISW